MNNIATTMKANYGISRRDFLSGRHGKSSQRDLLESVLKDISGGILLFPDSLYDGASKKMHRARAKKSLKRLESMAQESGGQMFKYRVLNLPHDEQDNVWRQKTISKARTADRRFFLNLGYEQAPRVGKLERQACLEGGFHIQGIVVLPPGKYPTENFEELSGGTFDYGAYLAKVAEQSLERDKENKLVYGNLPLALDSTLVWYLQTLKNHRAGVSRNPSTHWRVSIPNEKRKVRR